MIQSKTEQTIERPAADIWAYAADILRHPEWMGVTDARLMRGTGADAGSRGRERLALGPFKWDVVFEVTEAVAGPTHRLALRQRGTVRPRDRPRARANRSCDDARDLRRRHRAARTLATARAAAGRGRQSRTGTGVAAPQEESRAIRSIRRRNALNPERVAKRGP